METTMFKKFQHYKSVYNDLELNKTTEDVAVDLHHLQVGVKIRYYTYYTVLTIVSIAIFFIALHYIKSDSFRTRLINEAGVSPVSSLCIAITGKSKTLPRRGCAKSAMNCARSTA